MAERSEASRAQVEAFGQRLTQLRVSAGDTQTDLAIAIGMAVSNITRWERGLCYPNASTLMAMSAHYCVSIDSLLFGSDAPTAGESSEIELVPVRIPAASPEPAAEVDQLQLSDIGEAAVRILDLQVSGLTELQGLRVRVGDMAAELLALRGVLAGALRGAKLAADSAALLETLGAGEGL